MNELCSPAAYLKFLQHKTIEIAGFYFDLMPRRGTHFRARATPPSVIFAPDNSLTCPGGQVPSSILIRCPSFRSGTSCSRPNVVACAPGVKPDRSPPDTARRQRSFSAKGLPKISFEKEVLCFIGDFHVEAALARSLLRHRRFSGIAP